MVEEDNGAAHALDADVKSDPSTKRGLSKIKAMNLP